jgi:hypothetical protein
VVRGKAIDKGSDVYHPLKGLRLDAEEVLSCWSANCAQSFMVQDVPAK